MGEGTHLQPRGGDAWWRDSPPPKQSRETLPKFDPI